LNSFGRGCDSPRLHSTRPSHLLGTRSWQATFTFDGRVFCNESSAPSACPERNRRVVEGQLRLLLTLRVIEGWSRDVLFYGLCLYDKNSKDCLYIGISNDPQKRLLTHNTSRGAEFTSHSNDFNLVFLEEYPDLREARTREVQIKKWSRKKKNVLIERYQKGLIQKVQSKFLTIFVSDTYQTLLFFNKCHNMGEMCEG